MDFFHRTVRDFLRDCYHDQLNGHLKAYFDPLVSLCKICLGLLKALPIDDLKYELTVNKIIGLTDELLYYAHEFEKTCTSDEETAHVAILDQLDVVNSHHARRIGNHWTHARDSPRARGLDKYREGGNCNFLALAIQARLVRYVRAKLQSDPRKMQKRGRPLLDYALRPLRSTPVSMPYHSTRDDPSLNIEMIELLLAQGADPNQPVHLYEGTSVWALFLISIYEASKQDGPGNVIPESLKEAWYQACEALIGAGAQSDGKSTFVKDRRQVYTSFILIGIFGVAEAAKLEEQIEIVAKERDQSRSSCVTM